MRTQLVDGLFADLLQVVRFLRVYGTVSSLEILAEIFSTKLTAHVHFGGNVPFPSPLNLLSHSATTTWLPSHGRHLGKVCENRNVLECLKPAKTMAFLNKKKSFIGVDAPLGYVPGLGRG